MSLYWTSVVLHHCLLCSTSSNMFHTIGGWWSYFQHMMIVFHINYLIFVVFAGDRPQLADLMNEIGAVIPAKWRDVGVQLGIAPDVLDGIQCQNAEKPRSCQTSFEQVFNEWRLQGSKTSYTWTHIIGILRRPAVGENALAETLATKFN